MCHKCLQAARVWVDPNQALQNFFKTRGFVVELGEGLTWFKHAQSNERNDQILCFFDEKAPMSGYSRPF